MFLLYLFFLPSKSTWNTNVMCRFKRRFLRYVKQRVESFSLLQEQQCLRIKAGVAMARVRRC